MKLGKHLGLLASLALAVGLFASLACGSKEVVVEVIKEVVVE